MYYPFIDHVNEQFEARFSNELYEIMAAGYLILQIVHKLCYHKIAMILSYYSKLMIKNKRAIFPLW